MAQQRQKITEMSSEVVDSNPYSRLMALKRMGIVDNYEAIRNYSIIIVGLGGIGSVAAEMLTRCGIGKLILFDYDTVEMANMNRLFFRPEQVGLSKVEASKRTLELINPDVQFETYSCNVTSMDSFPILMDRIKNGGIKKDSQKTRVDLVLGCVDNFEARVAINQACLELDQPWMESGVSENAVSGHIQFIVPGSSACFQCAPPLIVASGIDERTLKREGVCAASLPTTMGIVAGLLIQNTLKYLLKFGETSVYLGYNAMKDFFPCYEMKPNPTCSNSFCVLRQREYQERKLKVEENKPQSTISNEKKVVHKNTFGIEIVSSSDSEISTSNTPKILLPQGIETEWDAPETSTTSTEGNVINTDSLDLSDLMNQLKEASN